MTATIGTSTNTNNEATSISVVANSSTAVTLLPAQNIPVEQPRIKVSIYNPSDVDMWVRAYPASDDNIKRGIIIPAGEGRTVMDGSDIYTGEISVIMQSGDPVSVNALWY